MVESDHMSDDDKAPLPTHQAAPPSLAAPMGLSRGLWVGFGLLALAVAAGGTVLHARLLQVGGILEHVIGEDWPLERAATEMEIGVIATTPAVLEYLREGGQEHLDRMESSAARFRRHAEQLERFADNSELQQVGRDAVGLHAEYMKLGNRIIVLADQRQAARIRFRTAAGESRQILTGLSQSGSHLRAVGAKGKPDPSAELDLLVNEIIVASAMYVAVPDPAARQAYLDTVAKIRVHAARYWTRTSPANGARSAPGIEESLNALVRAADEIMAVTDAIRFYRQDFSSSLLGIQYVLDHRMLPLIAAEVTGEADKAKSETARASQLLFVMGILAVALGGGMAVAISRASIARRTSALQQELAERKKSESSIQEAREAAESANRAKSVFLATMSHEIRTPLNGIIGMVDLLGYSPLNTDQAQMVRTVNVSAYALLNIIGDILDFSKIEAGELTVEKVDMSIADVFDSAMETLSQLAASKNIDLVAFVNPEAPDGVKGDPVRIRQVLFNLVGNAIKFSEARDGSRRAVSVRVDPSPGMADGKVGIRFTVADSGIGISESNLARLFTPFFQAGASTTRRFGGSGLGLSICKKLINLMGGDIGVKSRLGEGTTFNFDIPFEAVPGTAATQAGADLAGVRVLLAFDDSLSGFAVSTYLMYSGAAVVVADDIEGAKRQLGIAAENKRPFDVVIFCHAAPEPDEAMNEAITALRGDAVSAGTGFLILTADRRHRNLADRPDTKHVLLYPLSRVALLAAAAALAGKTDAAGQRTAGKSPARLNPDGAPPRGERILLAEDNAINQMVILRQLKHLGFDAKVAADGKAAWQMLDHEEFDLLMTDCHMPEMDGFELAEAIRKRERGGAARLPIVAITANALRGDAERCFAAGMDDFLSKPVELGKMSAALNKWLRPVPAEQGARAADPTAELPRQGNDELAARESIGGAETMEASDPVDIAMLARLLGTEDAESLKSIILFFWETMAATPAELRRHFDARNAKLLRDAAHAAKGASASVGAVAASELLKKLQFAAGHADWKQVADIMPGVDAAFADLKQYIGSVEADPSKLSIRAAMHA